MPVIRNSFLCAALTCFFLSTGCEFAAKRVFKEARGARTKGMTLPRGSRTTYKEFRGVTVKEPDSDVEPLVSRTFIRALPIELRRQLTSVSGAMFRRKGDPDLEIAAKVLWYYEAGGLGGLIGSNSYAVVLYTLSAGGQTLDQIQMVTKSAATRTGDDDMARSSVKGLVNWLQARREGKFDDETSAEEDDDEDEDKNHES
ncbi:MAG TPA: hypothetical protein VNT79_00675 [Phycisphaerae bacterium]|nr:hypothetical protein [Phycisphaerae bacterium]